MSEESLPFPVHGTRTTGTPEDASHRAQGTADAARALYFANLLAGLTGAPVLHLHYKGIYGSASAAATGPLRHKTTRYVSTEEAPNEPPTKIVRLAWLPEGFVITPRSAAAPKGYGLPPTPNKRGTPGGYCTEVIINRFEFNQYPDALYKKHHGVPPDDTRVCAANLFFMDWEREKGPFGIGMPVSGDKDSRKSWRPQFKNRFETNYSETETKSWYCHRPQETKETPDRKYLRDQANLIRAAAGKLPLGPPLRGREGELSESPIYMAGWSGCYGHDSRDFREGHLSFELRYEYRAANADSAGENLFFSTASFDADFLASAVEGWRLSPGHYASMIDDWNLEEQAYACVDSAARPVDGLLKTTQLPPYGLDAQTEPFIPPRKGNEAVQIFSSLSVFADFGASGRPTKVAADKLPPQYSRVGLDPLHKSAAFFSPFLLKPPQGFEYRAPQWVTLGGRRLWVWKEWGGPIVAVLAASRFSDKDDKEMLRIITLEREVGTGSPDHRPPAFLVVREGLVNDFEKTQEVLDSFQFPVTTGVMSTVKMSDSGKKAVFCFARPKPNLHRFRNDWLWAVSPPDPGNLILDSLEALSVDDPWGNLKRHVWGQELVFKEWTESGGFRDLGTDSLDINPEYSIEEPVWTGKTTCQGNYRIFADYDGESLVYARVHVNSEFYNSGTNPSQAGVHGAHVFRRNLFGKIVFPGGTELVYADSQMNLTTGASGYLRQILWMDIMRPKDVVYLHSDLSGGLRPAASCAVVSRGKVVKTLPDVLQSPRDDRMFKVMRWDYLGGILKFDGSHQAGLNQYTYSGSKGDRTVSFTPNIDDRFLPPFSYKAALVKAGLGMNPLPYGHSLNTIFQYDFVGPEIHTPLEGVSDRMQAEFYRGEVIVAGVVESPFDLPGRGWQGDDKYFYESSLDLKAITGIPDLSNNINPIGTI